MVRNLYRLAEDIHLKVNHDVTYMTDARQYGVPDKWKVATPGGFEDCDGYAMAKRSLLLDAGWPVNKQALCTCRDENGEGHMVLMVDTDNGVFILDNRRDWPVKPSELPYKWAMILCGQDWHVLSGFSQS